MLSDRYLLANVVYQGHAGGLDVAALWEVGRSATGGLMPDLTIVLDLPVAAAAGRMQRPLDRMELQGAAFHERAAGLSGRSRAVPGSHRGARRGTADRDRPGNDPCPRPNADSPRRHRGGGFPLTPGPYPPYELARNPRTRRGCGVVSPRAGHRRLASSFLFVGPEGIGKRMFAHKLAQALLCQARPEAALDPCEVCPACRQVIAGDAPRFGIGGQARGQVVHSRGAFDRRQGAPHA